MDTKEIQNENTAEPSSVIHRRKRQHIERICPDIASARRRHREEAADTEEPKDSAPEEAVQDAEKEKAPAEETEQDVSAKTSGPEAQEKETTVKEEKESAAAVIREAAEKAAEQAEESDQQKEPERKKVRKEPAQRPAKKKPRKKHFIHVLLWLIGIATCLVIAAGIAGYLYYRSLLAGIPELDLNKRYEYSTASTLYDNKGNFIASYAGNENVQWVTMDEIPQTMRDAIVSIEDKRFYEHNGVDAKRLTGAVIGQITGNASYGASTITQQLIKNNYLSSEVTYKRKAQEIHLALELEKHLSKDEILEWYLNTVFFGNSDYGIKRAAYDYFGVSDLHQLTTRECAMLAGLVQSPNNYNPKLNTLNRKMDITNERTDTVLYAMYENGKLSEDEYNKALKERPVIRTESDRTKLYDYPIFVEYCIENVASELLEQEGREVTTENIEEEKRFLRNAGYEICMSMDKDMQDILQSAITNYTNYPKTWSGEQVEASAVIMDQHTGEVVAMVGGREEPTEPEGFNRATDSTQAVGSSIKPLSVYAPALETGDYPGTTVLDVQSPIEGWYNDDLTLGYPGGDCINGPITMRRALELSHNIPAARFLLEHVGLDRSYNFMIQEGFNPDHLSRTAAGIGLGATDVTTLEMTAGYACLANEGVYIEPHAYTLVKDRFGNVILNGKDEIDTHRVFSQSTSWLITDMMHSNMDEGLGRLAKLETVTSCGKTGTHEHQALSFGGYTHYYTSFLRISADTYATMSNSSSFYQASPLWKSYMDPIHEDKADVPILDVTAEQLGIKQYHVCTNTGMLAQDWCPSDMEYAAPSNAPTVVCDGVHSWGIEQYSDENGQYPGYWDDQGNWIGQGWWDTDGYHPQ
ncbi:MAG: transglycosylase domain-containing protein [Bulleidia sp.]|nr:transglycosylase domain-containing protein [Bulleidia sp.]